MVVWLRPDYILAIITSLYCCPQLVSSKTYDKFWCATEEGYHQLSCPDETALLTDVTIRKVYRRTQMCAPDVHADFLIQCQEIIDGPLCEGNKTCSIEISSRNYLKCGNKSFAPTYFYVKYTCTQIYTMCHDIAPIRNTLYGFIVSPAYPHPMADNLKCSINIEAGPSMYIELAPIEVRLQDAVKCRSEYLEIFGYISSVLNNSDSDDMASNKISKDVWKSYYTWCGAEHSSNNPSRNARYLISSNSLYISLQTAVSKKSRFFKIRYKVVPSTARAHYDQDGIAYEPSESLTHPHTTSTTTLLTTLAVPTVDNHVMKNINGTVTKRAFKKEIIIGIIAGVIVLVIAIVVGIGIFIFMKKRTTAAPTTISKATTATPLNSAGKKSTTPAVAVPNSALKSSTKTLDKTPLLEQSANKTSETAAKRKLVPERTVHIADISSSRFKAANNTVTDTTTATATTTTTTTTTTAATTTTTGTTASHTTTAIKEATSISPEAAVTLTAPSTNKPALTVAESGIYGADLSDDVPFVSKSVPATEPPKVYGADLPDKSDFNAPVTVVINPFNEHATTAPTTIANSVSASFVPNNIIKDALPEEKEALLTSFVNDRHLDETVRSAYSHLIDATISENEGGIGSASVASSASQSRRTSHAKQPLLSHERNNLEAVSRKTTPFNPLHVILKKDANKYYTTEYI